jgi:hypothetical protein
MKGICNLYIYICNVDNMNSLYTGLGITISLDTVAAFTVAVLLASGSFIFKSPNTYHFRILFI